MDGKSLDTAIAEFGEARGPDSADARAIARFRSFLAAHGGLRTTAAPGGARSAGRISALRCFHFSQFLEWYLPEKEGLARDEVEESRAALDRFNAYLLSRGLIGEEDFREHGESIRESEEGPPVFQEIAPGEESEIPSPGLAEERDFYVPGEYESILTGEFILTKVQEGILVARRERDPAEIGPILVDRTVSGGSRVGDRVHMSLGKAGDHWNLLTLGRRRD
jgi:hypothetical protein